MGHNAKVISSWSNHGCNAQEIVASPDGSCASKRAGMGSHLSLRFKAHNGSEVWRAAFAFDLERRACVLVAGDKQGRDEKAFYKRLITTADRRFDTHLGNLPKVRKKSP